jgi:hypothetical protein
MQLGSGCPRLAYWLGHFTWDMMMHAVVAALAVATFAAFRDEATTGG